MSLSVGQLPIIEIIAMWPDSDEALRTARPEVEIGNSK